MSSSFLRNHLLSQEMTFYKWSHWSGFVSNIEECINVPEQLSLGSFNISSESLLVLFIVSYIYLFSHL